ncbi:antigen 5 like allergen Cul n 1-like isoform X2 [Culicoides brevitarsis]
MIVRRKHIGCPGVAVNQCGSDGFTEIPMNSTLKEKILYKHNFYRNQLAGGNLTGLTALLPATRMPTYEWDDELSYLAQINANQCKFGHDECRSTKNFPFAGQNIAWSRNARSHEAAIERAIDSWWQEFNVTSQSDIDAFQPGQHIIGHFTAMAQDRSNRVGCAASFYNKAERYVVCNYGYSNFQGEKVYESGTTASGCTTGTNPTFPNLCSTQEVVHPW